MERSKERKKRRQSALASTRHNHTSFRFSQEKKLKHKSDLPSHRAYHTKAEHHSNEKTNKRPMSDKPQRRISRQNLFESAKKNRRQSLQEQPTLQNFRPIVTRKDKKDQIIQLLREYKIKYYALDQALKKACDKYNDDVLAYSDEEILDIRNKMSYLTDEFTAKTFIADLHYQNLIGKNISTYVNELFNDKDYMATLDPSGVFIFQ